MWAETILSMLRAVRRERPLIHMLPNQVTAAFCADAIAAVGGRPLMALAPEEMPEIVSHAKGLAVNMGQPGKEKGLACALALETAKDAGLYTMFDPVGAGASVYRRELAKHLLAIPWPGVVKGNGAELAALFAEGLTHEGVDSLEEYENESAVEAFLRHASASGRLLVVAQTGKIDRILWIDPASGFLRRILVEGKKEGEQTLVGTGCVAGAVMGTLLAAVRGEEKRRKDDKVSVLQMGEKAMLEAERLALAAAGAVGIVSFCKERQPGMAGYGTGKTAFLDALGCLDEAACGRYLETHIREGK